MAKVILVDNFNRETIADKLLQADLTEEAAKTAADNYNSKYGPDWNWFARAVSDDYKLWGGIAELV